MQPSTVEPNPNGHPQQVGEQDAAGKAGRPKRIFRLAPIRFHFTFLLLFAFIAVSGLAGGPSAALTALYLVALFGSVLLHEMAHVLAAGFVGIPTTSITLYPIGGVSRFEKEPEAKHEIWISLAGPVANLLIGGAIYAYLAYNGWLIPADQMLKPTDANLLQRIGAGNFLLAFFNLVPALPMDGGRIFRGILARWRSKDDATHIAAVTGQAFAFLLGMFALVSGQMFLVFIAIVLYFGAAQEDAAAIGHKLLHGVPVRAAMLTNFKTLSHGNSIRDAADLMLATSQHDFPVVVGDQVIGVLDKNSLLQTMASEGPETYVAGAMDRNFVRLDPEMDLSDAMPLLARIRGCAVVMQGERLLGLLTKENLSEYLTLRRFGLKAS